MSRTRHPRPARPSAALVHRVRTALAGEQHTVQWLAQRFGASTASVTRAVHLLGLRVERVVVAPHRVVEVVRGG